MTAHHSADVAAAPPHARATIALAILGIFVTYVPVTAVSVALTTIGADTGATTSGLQWVSDAYVIPMAAAVLSAGVFGDLYGRRRIYVIGMVLTVLGGAVAGLLAGLFDDHSLALLWTGQAVAGLGAGLLIPTTLALIAQVTPDFKQRGKYIGLWSTGLMLGLALGPVISGLVILVADWQWIFAPTVLMALAAGAAAQTLMVESEPVPGRHLDWAGQITASIAIAASIFGIIEGGAVGWTSWQAVVGLGVGILSAVVFLLVERRVESPLMDLKLFSSPSFSAAGFAGVIALFSIVGCMFLLSLFFGYAQGLEPIQIAGRLLFITLVGAATGPLAARLMHTYSPMTVLAGGLVLSGLGLFTLTSIDASTGIADLAWRLVIFGLGNTLTMTAVSTAAINSVDLRYAGMAAATNTMLRQYGGALGPAILGVVFSHQLAGGASVSEAFGAAIITNVVLLGLAAVVCVVAGRVEARTRREATTA
ncbi:MAG: MFS transporter [Nocardioides sp.]|uniref:MFS transporter n=1 Tax=Nocardioides sp. TaxID=35761 RepID=UPI003F0CD16C